MPSKYPAIILLLIFINSTFSQSPTTVLQLCRHGARAPLVSTYDPSWPHWELGLLTPVGMRMHYVLGKALLEDYPEILGMPYNYTYVNILSDDSQRCFQSASSQSFGIWDGSGPGLGATYPAGIAVPPYNITETNLVLQNLNDNEAIPGNYYPAIISITSGNTSYIYEQPCPGYQLIVTQRMMDNNTAAAWNTFSAEIQYAQQYTSVNLTSPLTFLPFIDAVFCDLAANRTLPGGMPYDPVLIPNMIFAFDWFATYTQYFGEPSLFMTATPFIWTFIEEVEGIINGSTHNFVVYSGHDSNIWPMLAVFGIITPECVMANYEAFNNNQQLPYPSCVGPRFAAQLRWEFYNETVPQIKMLYNDIAIALCNGNTLCPWSTYKQMMLNAIENSTFDQFYTACINNQTESNSFKTVEKQEFTKNTQVTKEMNVTRIALSFILICLAGLVIKTVAQKKKLENKVREIDNINSRSNYMVL